MWNESQNDLDGPTSKVENAIRFAPDWMDFFGSDSGYTPAYTDDSVIAQSNFPSAESLWPDDRDIDGQSADAVDKQPQLEANIAAEATADDGSDDKTPASGSEAPMTAKEVEEAFRALATNDPAKMEQAADRVSKLTSADLELLTAQQRSEINKNMSADQLALLKQTNQDVHLKLLSVVSGIPEAQLTELTSSDIQKLTDEQRMAFVKDTTPEQFKALSVHAQSNLFKVLDGLPPEQKLALLQQLSSAKLESIPSYPRSALIKNLSVDQIRQLPREKQLTFAEQGLPTSEKMRLVNEMSASEIAKLPTEQRSGLFFSPTHTDAALMKNVPIEKRMAMLKGMSFERYSGLMSGNSQRAIPVGIHVEMLNEATPEEIRQLDYNARVTLMNHTLQPAEVAKLNGTAKVALLTSLSQAQLKDTPADTLRAYAEGLSGADSLELMRSVKTVSVLELLPADARLKMLQSLNTEQVQELSRLHSRLATMIKDLEPKQAKNLLQSWGTTEKSAQLSEKAFVELLKAAGSIEVADLTQEAKNAWRTRLEPLRRSHPEIYSALSSNPPGDRPGGGGSGGNGGGGSGGNDRPPGGGRPLVGPDRPATPGGNGGIRPPTGIDNPPPGKDAPPPAVPRANPPGTPRPDPTTSIDVGSGTDRRRYRPTGLSIGNSNLLQQFEGAPLPTKDGVTEIANPNLSEFNAVQVNEDGKTVTKYVKPAGANKGTYNLVVTDGVQSLVRDNKYIMMSSEMYADYRRRTALARGEQITGDKPRDAATPEVQNTNKMLAELEQGRVELTRDVFIKANMHPSTESPAEFLKSLRTANDLARGKMTPVQQTRVNELLSDLENRNETSLREFSARVKAPAATSIAANPVTVTVLGKDPAGGYINPPGEIRPGPVAIHGPARPTLVGAAEPLQTPAATQKGTGTNRPTEPTAKGKPKPGGGATASVAGLGLGVGIALWATSWIE
ncbi:MAG: hypothetical protein K2X93_20950 [Candidatus Obscuribacterales bacterium]|nr:hypothetical protein [Candidatus Obscuribacterales bacterium]